MGEYEKKSCDLVASRMGGLPSAVKGVGGAMVLYLPAGHLLPAAVPDNLRGPFALFRAVQDMISWH